MKKIISILMVFAMLCTLCFSANAELGEHKYIDESNTIVSTDGKWEYYKTGKITCALVTYKGDEREYLKIPTKVDGYTVSALYSLYIEKLPSDVETLYIPKTVKMICQSDSDVSASGHFDFKFEKISVSKDNKYFSSKGGVLFNKNKTTLFYYPRLKKDKSYTVPNTVKTVEAGAFSDYYLENKYLKNLTLSENVAKVNSYTDGGFPQGLKKLYIKTLKLDDAHFIGQCLPDKTTVYCFKNSAAHIVLKKTNHTVKFLSKPTKPESTKITKVGYSSSKGLKLTLKKVNCAGYKVYRYSSKLKKYEYIGYTKSTTFYDNEAKIGKTYKYRVRAYNKKNLVKAHSAYSKGKSVKLKVVAAFV